VLATRFIASTGKSNIDAPERQMQIDPIVERLRQIRKTQPDRRYRYNSPGHAANQLVRKFQHIALKRGLSQDGIPSFRLGGIVATMR
jgi:hypothetical protein